MTTFSDAFPDANASLETTGRWELGVAEADNFQIVSNKLRTKTVNTSSDDTYITTQPGADQFSQIDIVTIAGATAKYPVVHCRKSRAQQTYYALQVGSDNLFDYYSLVNTSYSDLGGASVTLGAAPKTLKLAVTGQSPNIQLNGYLDGVLLTPTPALNSLINSGYVGIHAVVVTGGALGDLELDNFLGGDGSGSATPITAALTDDLAG